MSLNTQILKALDYFTISHEVEEFDKIHEVIQKDIIFKGTNLWILMFAIIIASVGLNMNSTAVIIGAMLISPLMGPINGMGYSIATYNFVLFKKAAKNFAFAVGSSLVASTLYFAISPVASAHSELLARTSPTIYDVMIALFGGLSGIIAISSKQKGNVIPGVAIATALMPPLCTAGYGLATGQFYFFFGALYLFTINTVFIAISSILISRFLKFPMRSLVEESSKKKVNRWISIVIAVTVLPSIYFGYRLIQKEKFTESANRYTKNISVFSGSYLLKSEIDASERSILLTFGGNALNEQAKSDIKKKAKDFNLKSATIEIEQGFAFGEVKDVDNEVFNLKNEIDRLNNIVAKVENQRDSVANKPMVGERILAEIGLLYPEIKSCSYANTVLFKNDSTDAKPVAVVIYTMQKSDVEKESNKSKDSVNSIDSDNEKRITDWTKTRLQTDNVQVYFITEEIVEKK